MSAPTFLGLPTAPRGVGHLRGAEPFPAAARRALADTQLRRNLGQATRTIRAKRAAVVGELPDWEQLRDAGQAIKTRTMAHLDRYLEQLEEQVTARGGVVHWARDANEANRIVTGLVQAAGATEAVKVKSIVTDEIGLNDALAAAGITAHETDLAELIVQLGHDRPSHILVPAIHRNRAEIREIFLREMADVDPGLTDSPAALAEAARPHLRRQFLSAKVGISGANFAIAETGTLCVVESEGNGRMCLTLPDTLITVMGIEKLLPTWADLGVFMQLLPRSSTGERMNPYTSMWTGVTPGDGPQQFHLVLLDNGRTAALADQEGRQALHCIRCSACLNVCPVYERVGGHAYGSVYPGPIGAVLSPMLTGVRGQRLPAVRLVAVRGVLRRLPGEDRHPVAAGPPAGPARRRGGADAPRAQPGGGDHGRRLVGHGQPRAVRGRAAGRAVRAAAGPRAARIRRLPPPLSAWTAARDAPRPPAQTFREWWQAAGARGSARGPRDRAGTRCSAGSAPRWAATPAGPARPRPAIRPARGYRTRGELDTPALLDLLAARLIDYRSQVRRTGPGQVLDTVRAALAERGARRVVLPPGLDLPGLGQPAPGQAVTLDGVELITDGGLSAQELDQADGVITRAAVAVAETGTIVLDAGPGQGRRALSLIPDYHLCLIEAGPGGRAGPRGRGPAAPGPPADLDQRPVGHQRHRTRPGRGRARPPHPRSHPHCRIDRQFDLDPLAGVGS